MLNDGYIASMIDSAEITHSTVFGNTVIVAVKLANGNVLVESATCDEIEYFDEETGMTIALSRIASKLYELEAYRINANKELNKFAKSAEIKSDVTYFDQDNGPQKEK